MSALVYMLGTACEKDKRFKKDNFYYLDTDDLKIVSQSCQIIKPTDLPSFGLKITDYGQIVSNAQTNTETYLNKLAADRKRINDKHNNLTVRK